MNTTEDHDMQLPAWLTSLGVALWVTAIVLLCLAIGTQNAATDDMVAAFISGF